jgi:16S rRNA (adenine1518-N6/adenine1519-N6)-dimethyltransferase
MTNDHFHSIHYQKPPDVRSLIRRFDLKPDRRFGQNFLIDQKALQKVVRAAGLSGAELILEVGAGLGSLTYYLSQAAREVIAVEYDRRLIPALEAALAAMSNVRLVVADVLEADFQKWTDDQDYEVVANIPYNITSALIRRFLEASHPPKKIVLMLQRQVAERIIAPPGKLSLLALSVQMYGEPRIVGNVPARAFFPEPKVDSSIIRIETDQSPRVDRELIPFVFLLAKAGFHQKRKQLRNSLPAGLGLNTEIVLTLLETCGIASNRRAQELSLGEWVSLARAYHSMA